MNGKHYLPHQTSILNMSARVTVLGLIVVTILIDLLPTVGYFGWIPAMIFMYFERKSLYVKYHATQILTVEMIKVVLSFALLILSIFFNFPYYTGEYGTDSFWNFARRIPGFRPNYYFCHSVNYAGLVCLEVPRIQVGGHAQLRI